MERVVEVSSVYDKSGVYKLLMVRMSWRTDEYPNVQLYMQQVQKCISPNEIGWSVRQSKSCFYEMPYCVNGTIEQTGLEDRPKSIWTDRMIGTQKGQDMELLQAEKWWQGNHNLSLSG